MQLQLNEFLEKFLPEYDKTKKECEENNSMDDFQDYLIDMFPEALDNFVNRLCEKQRRFCADIVEDRINDHEIEPFEGGIYVDSIEVLDAEQPIIDEL